jgi:hypothetical protein
LPPVREVPFPENAADELLRPDLRKFLEGMGSMEPPPQLFESLHLLLTIGADGEVLQDPFRLSSLQIIVCVSGKQGSVC